MILMVKGLTKLTFDGFKPFVSEQEPHHGFKSRRERPIDWIKMPWNYVEA